MIPSEYFDVLSVLHMATSHVTFCWRILGGLSGKYLCFHARHVAEKKMEASIQSSAQLSLQCMGSFNFYAFLHR